MQLGYLNTFSKVDRNCQTEQCHIIGTFIALLEWLADDINSVSDIDMKRNGQTYLLCVVLFIRHN